MQMESVMITQRNLVSTIWQYVGVYHVVNTDLGQFFRKSMVKSVVVVVTAVVRRKAFFILSNVLPVLIDQNNIFIFMVLEQAFTHSFHAGIRLIIINKTHQVKRLSNENGWKLNGGWDGFIWTSIWINFASTIFIHTFVLRVLLYKEKRKYHFWTSTFTFICVCLHPPFTSANGCDGDDGFSFYIHTNNKKYFPTLVELCAVSPKRKLTASWINKIVHSKSFVLQNPNRFSVS